MLNILPIKAGERPLFKALELVETIYRDYKRNQNPYDSIKSDYILTTVAKLYVFAEILRLREYKGLRNTSMDLFPHLTSLPLIFNTQQVKSWEVEKKWNNRNFIPFQQYLLEYESLFDTLSRSNLYQTTNPTQDYIWKQWFLHTPLAEIINTIEYSAQSLLEWNSKRTDPTPLEQNLLTLSKSIGLSPITSNFWYLFQLLGQEKTNIWNVFLTENDEPSAVNDLISIWEKSFNLPTDSLNALIYEDSPLINLGFYNSLSKKYDSWTEYWNNIEQFKIPNINKKLLDQNNILQLLLRKTNTHMIVPIENFSYINGINEKLQLIKNLNYGKVLIHGKSLSGKKTLIHSILNTLNLQGFTINHKDRKAQDKTFLELMFADKLLSTFPKSALIIDNAETKFDLKSLDTYNSSQSLQFWTISDLKDLDVKFFQQFDLILEIQSPPLQARIDLAKKYFQDDSLSIRIAQNIKTPFEITRIGNLCHIAKNWSWEHISLLMDSFNSTNVSNKKFDLNRLNNNEEITSLVGYPELDELLNNLQTFYKNPHKYITMGAKADKGMLLVGPPGTGKTHFVRNLSKMVDIPIFAPETSMLASNLDFISKMFLELKNNSPCILFLDEIDTLIANPRNFAGVDLEKQKIVNTFLSNVDGIESNEGILIIGTTHRSGNFDPAATRSGRLSKIIHLNLPNEIARQKIWKEHIKNKKTHSSVTLLELSKLSVSFSCADIMDAANKAAILAVETNKNEITIDDFKVACDETFWGFSSKNMIITEKQKQLTAYHEAGHAVMAWIHGYNVPRITIRPRHNMLGATHFIGEEGNFNSSITDIYKKLELYLGGICAEKLFFNEYEDGGTSDLKAAHSLLFNAIANAGLGKSGAIYLGNPSVWSNEKRCDLEKEEKEIMQQIFISTEKHLKNNQSLIEELAKELLSQRELSGESLHYFKDAILNSEPMLFTQKSKVEEHILHIKNNNI